MRFRDSFGFDIDYKIIFTFLGWLWRLIFIGFPDWVVSTGKS